MVVYADERVMQAEHVDRARDILSRRRDAEARGHLDDLGSEALDLIADVLGPRHVTDVPPGWTDAQVEALVRELFAVRAHRPQPFTDEEWRKQRRVSVSSYNMLRREVIEDIEAGEYE